MKKGFAMLVGLVLLELTGGCAKHVTVQKSLVAQDNLLPKLHMNSPVSIVALPHESNEQVNFCKKGLGPMTLVYNDVTDYAVQSMVDILSRNNVRVVNDAPKSLTVSVIQASCDQELAAMNYIVDISVAAGDKPPKQFSGNQRLWSAHALSFTVTAATLNAVLEMFKDKEIREYLETN